MSVANDDAYALKISDFLDNNVPAKNLTESHSLKIVSGKKWYVLSVKNETPQPMKLVFSNPRINAGPVSTYLVAGSNVEDVKRGTELKPFLSFAHEFTLPANSSRKIVLEVDYGTVGFVMNGFYVEAAQAYHERMLKNNMLKSFILGGFVIIFFYNLFLFISLRTKAYFWYVVYMFLLILLAMQLSGIGHAFLWGSSEYLSRYAFVFLYPVMFAAALQFSRVFLKTKERLLLMDRVLFFFIVLFVLLPVVMMAGYFGYAPKVFYTASLVLCILPFLGAYLYFKGFKEVRFYVIAWSGWVLGMLPTILLFRGYDFDYETVVNTARVGLWFEATVLSLALADQIKILRDQRNSAVSKYEAQRHMLEIQSRQAQMGEVIGIVGHQWKQPLTLIGMLAELTGDDVSRSKDAAAKQIVANMKNIQDVVKGMNKTLNDFKNFFSPNKRIEDFGIYACIKDILEMVGKQYEHEKITFEFICGDEDVYIEGHENEFKQVIINLFNNARDVFVKKNIQNRKITVDISSSDKGAVLKISDNGGGIPEDEIGKIFEQYFTTKGDKGTGIGLHLGKVIIERSFHGEMVAQNTKEGAMFVIKIPK